MIEEKFGLSLMDELIERTQSASDGVSVSTDTYPDEELLNMVIYLSEKSNTPAPDLVRILGDYAFQEFSSAYPIFVEKKSFKEFLLSSHSVVHVEVKKLYPEAELPNFHDEDPGDHKLIMKYFSKRNSPTLAKGLMMRAAKYFKVDLNVEITEAQENGVSHHRSNISFS
jgi:hypothetical protein